VAVRKSTLASSVCSGMAPIFWVSLAGRFPPRQTAAANDLHPRPCVIVFFTASSSPGGRPPVSQLLADPFGHQRGVQVRLLISITFTLTFRSISSPVPAGVYPLRPRGRSPCRTGCISVTSLRAGAGDLHLPNCRVRGWPVEFLVHKSPQFYDPRSGIPRNWPWEQTRCSATAA